MRNEIIVQDKLDFFVNFFKVEKLRYLFFFFSVILKPCLKIYKGRKMRKFLCNLFFSFAYDEKIDLYRHLYFSLIRFEFIFCITNICFCYLSSDFVQIRKSTALSSHLAFIHLDVVKIYQLSKKFLFQQLLLPRPT